ncbi:PD40 domain-containing protein [Actinoplanes friuliensis]|nr:PD40 domain-containing protein [Actinoplanes friuliensis]
MNRPMEELLRETVHDLAGEARTATDLATGARVRGRRLRRRRQAGYVVAVVLLAALTTVPYAVLRDTALPPLPPSTGISSAPVPQTSRWSAKEPFGLPGGTVITGVGGVSTETGTGQSLVLERNAKQYKALPASTTASWPSPNGRWVAVQDDQRAGQIGVRRVSTGNIQWLPGEKLSGPAWSPDGDRLLLTTEEGGFAVVTAATAAVKTHSVDQSKFACTDSCQYSWLPQGDQVAIALTAGHVSEAERDRVEGLAIFAAATGAPVRTVPVPGAPVGQDAWSPDGRLVLIEPERLDSSDLRIAEVETGRVLGTFRAWSGQFLRDGSILGLDDGAVTRYDASGRALQKVILPTFLARREFTVGPA